MIRLMPPNTMTDAYMCIRRGVPIMLAVACNGALAIEPQKHRRTKMIIGDEHEVLVLGMFGLDEHPASLRMEPDALKRKRGVSYA